MIKPVVYKTVDEVFAIGLIYSAPDLNEGETITAVEATVSPEGLILESALIDGSTVKAIISEGNSGKEYKVLFKVTTSAGHIYRNPDKEEIIVKVK